MNNYQQQQQLSPSQGIMMATSSCSGGGTAMATDLIQKYLDENKQLILAILDNQRLGKLNECATYQAKLQNNLLLLAAIADAQPQTPCPIMQVRNESPMQLQHHDNGQQVQYTLQQQQQQIQMMQYPSILGQRNMASLPAYMQSASRTQTPLHHSSTPHHPQQLLHAASPNSGFISTGTCNNLQFNMQAAEIGMVNAVSLNVSSGNYHDLISHGGLTYSNAHSNMGLNVNRPHCDHHATGANTTIEQGDSESAAQDSESASYLNIPDDHAS